MINVVLDANFLFVPFQFRVDIFEHLGKMFGKFEPIVLSTTLEELRNISERKSTKIQTLALSALELTRKCKIVKVEREKGESFDDVLIRVANERKYLVATIDQTLRKKLRKKGIATVFLREKSHLEVDGFS